MVKTWVWSLGFDGRRLGFDPWVRKIPWRRECIEIYTLPCIKYVTNENLLYSTGTLLSAMWWPKWEGNSKRRGYMHTYSWFTQAWIKEDQGRIKTFLSNGEFVSLNAGPQSLTWHPQVQVPFNVQHFTDSRNAMYHLCHVIPSYYSSVQGSTLQEHR